MKSRLLGLLGSLLIVSLIVAAAPVSARSDSASSLGLGFDLRVELLRRLGAMPSFSACIVKGEDVVWQGSWGWADVYASVPATDETQYAIGSVSKVITAVAILQLAEEGHFALDDDVSPHLPFDLRNPAFPEEPITFRMLLSHTASLAGGNEHFFSTFYFNPYELAELGSFLTPADSDYWPAYWRDVPPGESMEYANIGFELLSLLVEQISGQTYEDHVRDAIFEPLGMTDSTFEATGATSPAMPYMAFLGIPIPMGHYEIGSLGAGGLRTTLADLGQLASALMNGGAYGGVQVLEPESVAEMQSRHAVGSVDGASGYGLGWMVFGNGGGDGDLGGHAGGAFGCRTMMQIRPSDQTAVIYTFNRLNPAIPPSLSPLMNYAADRLEAILWDLADQF